LNGDWIISLKDFPEIVEVKGDKQVSVSANIRDGTLY